MQSTLRSAKATVFLALMALSGCALGPVDGAQMNQNGTIKFWGYTTSPGDQVRMETYVPLLNRWMPVQTLNGTNYPPIYSSTTPIGVNLSAPLYEWFATVKIPPLAFQSSATARVRVWVGPESNPASAIMYDQAGYDCVFANAGPPPVDILANAVSCSAATNGGSPRYEVTIRQWSPSR